MREINSFDRTVEMFSDIGADSIFLERYQDGLITGIPCNSKTGNLWVGFSMISDIEEAKKCKYPKIYREDDKKIKMALSSKENK